ncbi:hypothetical protein N0V93_001938 [Gnomoniopsis smithogilvyi]|uniref:Uncharacterized protein n=1 Tax=Gnomoniopsis smithogilvyi TaxID=1191159 RepID=A0A9W8Z4W8_9PEZI|nr:hypothetical protein N0V93_001938 [Gnomoniopsis smithogilvyi]
MKASFIALALLSQIRSSLANWSPPGAALSWDGLNQISVYGVDESGQIREWQWKGSGSWTGPSYIGATAQIGSTLAAVNDGDSTAIIRKEYFRTAGWMGPFSPNYVPQLCVTEGGGVNNLKEDRLA